MPLVFGHRPQWLRVLLVPSQPFVETLRLIPDGDSDPSNDLQITDRVELRFDAGLQPVGGDPAQTLVPTERAITGDPQPDGTVVFRLAAEAVNTLIRECAPLSRRVRVTIGDLTWGTGYFEIEGDW